MHTVSLVLGCALLAPAFGMLIAEPLIKNDNETDTDYYEYAPSNESMAACRFETPDEQIQEIQNASKTTLNFQEYLSFFDKCNQYYRKRTFDHIDTNKDGVVSVDELKANFAEEKRRQEEAQRRWAQTTFEQYDNNGDGELGKKELQKYLKFRNLDASNLVSYLSDNDIKKMDFEQFFDFQASIPNDTFPWKHADDYDMYFQVLPHYDYAAEVDGIMDNSSKPYGLIPSHLTRDVKTKPETMQALVDPVPFNSSAVQISPPKHDVQISPPKPDAPQPLVQISPPKPDSANSAPKPLVQISPPKPPGANSTSPGIPMVKPLPAVLNQHMNQTNATVPSIGMATAAVMPPATA